MNNSLRISQLILALSLISVTGIAQNISSPYSIIGIGDIENSYFNRNSGMANTGIGMRSGKNLYQANPASYSALDNQFFTFEIGTQGKTVKYVGNKVDPNENSNGDFTIKKVSAGFKAAKRWGVGVGLAPFSNVNYLFTVKKNIGGAGSDYVSSYDGNGGVNQIYLANSYEIIKTQKSKLSLGVNAAFLFGSIKQTENIFDANSESALSSTRNNYIRKLHPTFGLQYSGLVTKKLDYTIGLIYSPETKLNGETSLLVVNNGTEEIRNEIIKSNKFTLPATYGAGLAITSNRRLTFAGDYKFQDWSSVNYKDRSAAYVNSQRISIGVDYNKLATEKDFIYEKYNLQAGLFHYNSELRINGIQLQEYGVTIGAGKPVGRYGKINMNLALEAGVRGTTKQNLIKENYAKLTLNISYRDFWYTKGRKYE